MVGLVEFQHHVVADINHIVDRAHACCGEPLSHPWGARTNRDTGDRDRHKSPAVLRAANIHADRSRTGVGDGELHLGLRKAKLRAKPCGKISGHPDVTPTVGAITSQIKIENDVGGDAQSRCIGNTQRGGRAQNHDPRMVGS